MVGEGNLFLERVAGKSVKMIDAESPRAPREQ
jgi:hypothetical protein